MARNLDYDGNPRLNRKRHLIEEDAAQLHHADLPPPPVEDPQKKTTELFEDLAAAYIKGEKLKDGLSEMDPLDFIPIEEGADNVAASARRRDEQLSQNGTVITYSMYQNAVDAIADNNWEMRLIYLEMDIPATPQGQNRVPNARKKNKKDWLSEFIDGAAMAGLLISFFSGSLHDAGLWGQTDTDHGSPAGITRASHIQIALALLIELGIAIEQIREMFKDPEVKPLIDRMAKSKSARKEVLAEIDLDYDAFIENQVVRDSKIIMGYVADYFARYGGLLSETKTLDHWIAYGAVTANQTMVRSALNVADNFSQDFADIRVDRLPGSEPQGKQSFWDFLKEIGGIHVGLRDSVMSLTETSNKMYDDIAQVMLYQISDRAMCCIVQILGIAEIDTSMLKTIAACLRVAAIDLSGRLIFFSNIVKRILASIFKAAIYELMAQVSKAMDKIIRKLVEWFSVDIPGAEACIGFFTIGEVLIGMVNNLENVIQEMLQEVLNQIADFGHPKKGRWEVSSDRRHLLGLSKLLNILALKLDAASACARDNRERVFQGDLEAKEAAAGEAIHTLIDHGPPSLQLTDVELAKYFPNLTPRTSSRYGYTYGTHTAQNVKDTRDKKRLSCGGEMSEEEIAEASRILRESMKATFSPDE